nr:MAG TPA: hypothetical protein [Caudoviricetes sp.]DAH85774.1 MAG TPA: hypothetical protein [Bacteriophage sp.]
MSSPDIRLMYNFILFASSKSPSSKSIFDKPSY